MFVQLGMALGFLHQLKEVAHVAKEIKDNVCPALDLK